MGSNLAITPYSELGRDEQIKNDLGNLLQGNDFDFENHFITEDDSHTLSTILKDVTTLIMNTESGKQATFTRDQIQDLGGKIIQKLGKAYTEDTSKVIPFGEMIKRRDAKNLIGLGGRSIEEMVGGKIITEIEVKRIKDEVKIELATMGEELK